MDPALAAWGCLRGLVVHACDDAGLINRTALARDPGGEPIFVVQRVNPLFAPPVHDDIEAVTARLEASGMATPRLVRTDAGELCAVAEDGAAWRVMTYVPGLTVHTVDSPGRGYEAGSLVARFHSALDDFDWSYRHVRPGAHDTPLHMERLDAAVRDGRPRQLADGILEGWRSWQGRLDLPARHAHGDLKISNLRFDAAGRAICLIDLDTLSRLPIDVELGDAWRSWCNPVGEDSVDTRLDPEILGAAVQGYRRHRALDRDEREGLAGGVERIALELAARFCRDAVEDCYFGWNAARFPSRAAHNLFRAEGQLALARSARSQRSVIEGLLG